MPGPRFRNLPRVPTIREVVPGAQVNIVLKADQSTGHTVVGAVQDVLTRGNHPRGIKVRLTDGRVGRVQTMATGASLSSMSSPSSLTYPPSITSNLGPSGATFPVTGGGYTSGMGNTTMEESASHASLFSQRHRPTGEQGELPAQEIGLEAYIKPAKQRGGKGKANWAPETAAGRTTTLAEFTSDPQTAVAKQRSGTEAGISTCPVCGVFEGDETAVAHHVSEHFAD
jgi:uncharacterized repeat protein (TIGR03833 family)